MKKSQKLKTSRSAFFAILMGLGILAACEEDRVNPFNEGKERDPYVTEQSVGGNYAILPQEALKVELSELRRAVAPYHDIQKAIDDGYNFEFTGYRAQMGYHYLKASLLDDQFDPARPEVLMYAPTPDGEMRFVGVEFAQPIEDMDNPQPAPEGFTGSEDVWSINTEFNVWTLHVWVGLHNPKGIFHPHNPRLPESNH